ncbi:recombinase family protein [Saccharopolyspora hattusasensis]|uniref:recombinase family protein n=1 Tax=Saccharopolyspora hattusasensis TaxID=1128679 RepID=UPI003D958D7A
MLLGLAGTFLAGLDLGPVTFGGTLSFFSLGLGGFGGCGAGAGGHSIVSWVGSTVRARGSSVAAASKKTGATVDRPSLTGLLRYAREGDTIVAHTLDRLGRSREHLIQLSKELSGRAVDLVILDQGIDTSRGSGSNGRGKDGAPAAPGSLGQ